MRAAHEAAGLAEPADAVAHTEATRFLTVEARLLDLGRYRDWLGLLHHDVRYRVPVRVTAMRGQQGDLLGGMDHFDEDHYSLAKRVERLVGQHAWTEDPPSRTRRFVTNTWVSASTGGDGAWDVVSYLLLFRSRLDVRAPDLLSAERADVLVRTPDGLRLKSRLVTVDEAVLRTQNLAVFL
ncbi:MAG: 3-phenylpropionate/cinnamic acid dioxygenase subunit beta [Acidimicrobiia bacterium]|nr:3-phenylpropionate/cinnamic acid dioxygenase subunit beta [Acidimicrobiia bacterium]